MKKALITGIFGQDGSYLYEILSNLGYEVYGIVRKNLSPNSNKIRNYLAQKNLVPTTYEIDLNNFDEINKIIKQIKPDEIYHLAAFHINSESSKSKLLDDKMLYDYNTKATSNILYSASELPNTKVVIAGSCLMFDNTKTNIQNEKTPFCSKSLYGLAKISECNLANYYRENGLHVSCAILYNHESSRRADNFVSRKIVKNLVKIKQGKLDNFILGNINIYKDWGYARDYALAMYNMTKQSQGNNYILSTGESHSIKELIETCAKYLNIDDVFSHIKIDDSIISRQNNSTLLGDPTFAKKTLNFTHSLNFTELIELMVKNELSGQLE